MSSNSCWHPLIFFTWVKGNKGDKGNRKELKVCKVSAELEQSLLSLNDFLIDKFEKVKESTLYCCTNLIGMIEVGAYGNVFKFIKNHFFF